MAHEVKRPDLMSNQIPWAKKTQVVGNVLGYDRRNPIDHIELQTKEPWALSTVDSGGGVNVEIDSEEVIGEYLKKSRGLTKSLNKYFDVSALDTSTAASFRPEAENWLKGIAPVPPDERPRKPNVFDWSPPRRGPTWKRHGRFGYHKSANSGSEISEYWIGSHFPFIHAVFETEYGDEEGLIVLWLDGKSASPEVWLGDVEGFLMANEESFDDPHSYVDYNARFENGWIWALHELGVFYEGNVPDWAIDVLSVDPDLMWPEVIEDLLPQLETLKPDLRKAVLTWLDNRQKEQEAATGQLFFWPRMER